MNRVTAVLALVVLALGSCRSSTEPDVTPPRAIPPVDSSILLGPPAALRVQAGGSVQTAGFGQAVPTAPTLVVMDARGHPLPGVTVTFEIVSGGGSLSSTTLTTDAVGQVSVVWTLGSSLGENALRASVAGLPPVTFGARAILGVPMALAFEAVDPVGDSLLNSFSDLPPDSVLPVIDLVSLRGDFKSDSLILTATFNGPVSLDFHAPNFLRGFIEFDVDDDASTGSPYSFANFYGVPARIGPEYRLTLYGSDMSVGASDNPYGTAVQASVSGRTVVVRIPMRLLGNDDGNFTVAGVFGPMDRATDVIPNAGQIRARRDGAASTTRVVRDGSGGLRAADATVGWGSPSRRLH